MPESADPNEIPQEADLTPIPLPAPLRESPPESSHQEKALSVQAALTEAEAAEEEGHESESVNRYLAVAAAAEHAHEWFIEAICCERVARFLSTPSPDQDVERAMRLCRRAALAYERCGMFAEAREASYQSMQIRRHHAGQLSLGVLLRWELWLYDVTSGFGHRPLRVMRTALLIMMAYATVFWLSGGVVDAEDGRRASCLDCLYFSGTTFTTVGFGDFIPAPAAWARLLAMSEGVVGAFLVGFFVVVLWRRLSHG